MNKVDLNDNVLETLKRLQEDNNVAISDNCADVVEAIGCIADTNTGLFPDDIRLSLIFELYCLYKDLQNLKSKK
jgi:hypothetical protein